MLKRLVVATIGLLGLVAVALGVASATLWRADDVLVAELGAGEPLVVTDPGVLELADARVTVRAEADGPVVLAVGRDTDVTAWVGDDPHQRVTGLSGWHELAAEDVAAPLPTATATPEGEAAAEGEAASEEPAPTATAADADAEEAVEVPDPAGSDLWVVEARGDGEAELTWTAQPGRWSLLAASTDGSPLRLSLAWPQVVTTPWLWPGVIVGSLLALGAAVVLVRDVLRSRRSDEEAWTPVVTGALPVVGEDGTSTQLTRRQMRELAARSASAARPRTGAVPQVPATVRPEARGTEAPTPAAGLEKSAPAGPEKSAPAGPEKSPVHAPEEDAATRAGAAATPTGVRAGIAATRRALRGAATTDAAAASVAETPAPAGGAADSDAPTPGGAGRREGRRVASTTPATGPARPDTAPRWSVGGGSSPWTSGRRDASDEPGAGRPVSTGAPAAPESETRTRPGAQPPASGRPAWLGRDDAGPGATGWTPVPPAPGAVAGRSTGPDSARPATGGEHAAPGGRGRRTADHTDPTGGRPTPPPALQGDTPQGAPRPAWLRDAPVPSGPRTTTAGEQPASRADAWRRAWGIAPTDDDSTSQEESR